MLCSFNILRFKRTSYFTRITARYWRPSMRWQKNSRIQRISTGISLIFYSRKKEIEKQRVNSLDTFSDFRLDFSLISSVAESCRKQCKDRKVLQVHNTKWMCIIEWLINRVGSYFSIAQRQWSILLCYSRGGRKRNNLSHRSLPLLQSRCAYASILFVIFHAVFCSMFGSRHSKLLLLALLASHCSSLLLDCDCF